MRIQHNIMAMNAYRNYTNNTSALSKNLEKLSSGYRINRAGDDAAGLAISEKMRAQITGLSAAQKNVKDGLSLVKTAEGATQEIHDMLNRMVSLAEQSANGTYQDEVDREAITDEFNQLKAEINRIADSSNFNGIKLLDGSLDVDGRVADTKTVFSGLTASSNHNGTAVGGFGGVNTKGSLMLTGVNLAAAAGAADKSDLSVRYHRDPKGEGKTSFTVDLDSANFANAKPGDKIENLIFGLDSATAPKDAPAATPKNNCLFLTKTSADAAAVVADTLKYSVTAGNEGITSEMVATAIQEAIDKNGGKVYLEPAAGGDRIEYTVTREGDKLKFEMTDDGYNAAVKANAADATKNYFQGNYNFAVNYKATGATDLETAFMTAVGDAQHGATSVITEGSPSTGTIYAEAVIRFDDTKDAATKKGINAIKDVIKDGAGLQIGDEYYIFAKSDEVKNRDYADNVKVVDISDLDNLASNDADKASVDLRKALDRLSVAAAGNEMFDVQVSKPNGDKYASLILTERSTYKGDANLTEKDFGLENQIRTFDSATSTTTVEKEAGTALTLQIGDTSDSFNQLSVSVSDMHTKALGIDSLSLGNQKGAQDAVQVIKDAINKVSSTRGRLGATQNRLEHTSNNLSVMKENIQDAEAAIRDTDVAEEMMAYTKNNILVQSAQAMLAQANQIPQGVLQLLG